MILNWIDQQAALDDLLAIISEARALLIQNLCAFQPFILGRV